MLATGRLEMMKMPRSTNIQNRTTGRSAAYIAFAGLGLIAFSGTAAATTVHFTTGNHPQTSESNILFGSKETGSTITGFVKNSTDSPIVTFSTLTGQTLLQKAKGQADIYQDVGNVNNSELTSLEITVPQGYGFSDFIMNPLNGTGSLTVTVFLTTNQSFSYNLGNGSNYLTITSTGGLMNEIELSFAGAGYFQQFKQPRISGVEYNNVPIPTPEPNGLAIFGGGLIGLGLLSRWARRRRQKIKA